MDSEPDGKPRRLTRAEAKARTRRLLLDAAARTFARKGYAGASVEEIAEAAGYSIGALYSNFGGKEELFIELMVGGAKARVERGRRIVAAVQDGTEEPEQALGRFFMEAADKDDDLPLLQAELWLYAMRNPRLKEALAEAQREPQAALEALMEPVLERVGAAGAVPPSAVATVASAMFQGLLRQRRLDPPSVPDDLLRQAMRWLFTGIANTPGPSAEEPS
ncbi:TetR/AcrR family transcriptional regulator [Actinomadura verrucosospora]|uniref:TetR family transcriptional regulator n=1 Tax=Actinomadura verrucosospora TaxID=46165 RepID=A0A7D3ZFH0_ACTVE|nr:TetR/AcrR family transcriptional regulator [Actinomadura verrucosospora]QKG22017.1 TetR family transcriptional regulator [Actinomadura verrucosospora]